jgi:hypothetical protein
LHVEQNRGLILVKAPTVDVRPLTIAAEIPESPLILTTAWVSAFGSGCWGWSGAGQLNWVVKVP